MKTPEELAEEYTKDWWGNLPEAEGMRKSARENFLAGYKAGFDAAITTQTKMGGAIDRMIQLAKKGLQDEDTRRDGGGV